MPTRKTYAALALTFALFAIYGSLVPLEFRAVPLDAAIARFRAIPYLQLGIESRADFVANILLFIPLGFLGAGALRADRRGAAGSLAAGAAIVAGSVALSVAIEFAQMFFPPRTVSLNDILAETIGGSLGVALWSISGMTVTEWTRHFFRERSRPTLFIHVLTVYAAAFLVAQLLPLDLAIAPADLADKFHAGRIILQPFGYPYASTFNMVWDIAGDVLVNAPIGALAMFGWTRGGRRRSTSAAFLIGMTVVAVLELAQVFVFSRVADVTDVATGTTGIALGVMAASQLARRGASEGDASRGGALRLWPLMAALVWLAAVLAYAWYPFDFVLDRAMLGDRLPTFLAVPFRSYYYGSEFHAFTELTRKFLLALPLGVLLRLTWPASPRRGIARLQTAILTTVLFGLFVGMEIGQLFLPDRVSDFTDVLVSVTGAFAGMYLVALLGPPVPVHVVDVRV